jgi:uncharacterized membrane protein
MTFLSNPGRCAGLLYVLASIAGFFAMGYVPDHLLVPNNTAATVNNIAAHELLFRFGIAAQIVGEAAFIFVALALYQLLKTINHPQATLMVILIGVSIPMSIANELNSLAALALIRGSDFLSIVDKPQRDAFAMFFLYLHGRGLVLAELFWGLWLFPLASLVYHSKFLPRFLGIWLALAGVAWVTLNLVGLLLPQYQGKVNTWTQPAVFGEIVFMFWLLLKGAKPRVQSHQGAIA